MFLGRWLLLTAAMFAGTALLYAIRLMLARRHLGQIDNRVGQATDRPVDTRSPRQRCMQLDDETSG
jgi:hypothetical protein